MMSNTKTVFMTPENLELLANNLQMINAEVRVSVHNRRVCVVTLHGDQTSVDLECILNLIDNETNRTDSFSNQMTNRNNVINGDRTNNDEPLSLREVMRRNMANRYTPNYRPLDIEYPNPSERENIRRLDGTWNRSGGLNRSDDE
jgi:hypothetical protein